MSNLYEWFHDDITWCANECSHTECERNIANRLTKGGLVSMAMFKGTETCPLTKDKEKYHLSCPLCGHDWWDYDAFPKYCPKCKANIK